MSTPWKSLLSSRHLLSGAMLRGMSRVPHSFPKVQNLLIQNVTPEDIGPGDRMAFLLKFPNLSSIFFRNCDVKTNYTFATFISQAKIVILDGDPKDPFLVDRLLQGTVVLDTCLVINEIYLPTWERHAVMTDGLSEGIEKGKILVCPDIILSQWAKLYDPLKLYVHK
jgi:hypothetical protein